MNVDLDYRQATPHDAPLLAAMNAQLIRDEGHRNAMTISELRERMTSWLQGEYRAVIFNQGSEAVGYALYRIEPEFVYLRQLFVVPELRRRGIGRSALEWLRKNAWSERPRVRIDVLVGNEAGKAFWKSADFADYCITMEREV